MRHTLKRYDSGQTLIEIIIALSVAVALITGITFAITSSLKNSTFSRNQNLASGYAQQGMEIVRAVRDRSWNAFFALGAANPNFCLSKDSQDLTVRPGSYCTSDGTKDGTPNVGIFVREVTIKPDDPKCAGAAGTKVKVTVSVAWKDSNCTSSGNPFCHKVELLSCFTQSNVVPTP